MDNSSSYMIIGEAYVHGIMDGEFMWAMPDITSMTSAEKRSSGGLMAEQALSFR